MSEDIIGYVAHDGDELDKTKAELAYALSVLDREREINSQLSYQLGKRTAALNDALDYVEADLLERFSVSGQNLRNQILAALIDEIKTGHAVGNEFPNGEEPTNA